MQKLLLAILLYLLAAATATAANTPLPVTPYRFGAVGDGIADDTVGIQNALLSSAPVFLPSGAKFRVTNVINVSRSVEMYGPGTIFPDMGLGTNRGVANYVFYITASDVHFHQFVVDSTGVANFSPATANHYLFYVVGGSNVHVDGVTITNWSYTDGNIGDSQPTPNLLVSHVFYVAGGGISKNVTFNFNNVNGCTGAAVFANDMTKLQVNHNKITDCNWYNINLHKNTDGAEIGYNTINMTRTSGVFWGGMINIMSQPDAAQVKNVWIHQNKLSGYVSYGAPLRVLSCSDCLVEKNILTGIKWGSWAIQGLDVVGYPYSTGILNAANGASGIGVATRTADGLASPASSQNITIRDNTLDAPTNVYLAPKTAATTFGDTKAATNSVTVNNASGIEIGQLVVDISHSADIPQWTYVTNVVGTTVTLSQKMTGSHTKDTLTFRNAGTGFAVNDTFFLAGGAGRPAKFIVKAVAGNGAIALAEVTDVGAYTVLPKNPVSMGATSGSGAGSPTFTVIWNLQSCIYVSHNGGNAVNTKLMHGLWIEKNQCNSTAYGAGWNAAVQIHGSAGSAYGGMNNVHVVGNRASVYSVAPGPAGGSIGIISGSLATAPMTNIWIHENELTELRSAARSAQPGIFVAHGQYVHSGGNKVNSEPQGIQSRRNALTSTTAATTTTDTLLGSTSFAVSRATGIARDMLVRDLTNSGDIPVGTYVLSVVGTTVNLSAAMTGTHLGDTLAFVNAGSAFAINDTFTLAGGTHTSPASFKVLAVAANGAILKTANVSPGAYSVFPADPVGINIISGSGTGAPTFTVTWGAYNLDDAPHSRPESNSKPVAE